MFEGLGSDVTEGSVRWGASEVCYAGVFPGSCMLEFEFNLFYLFLLYCFTNIL